MTGIVEAQQALAARGAMGVKRARLGRGHVGSEARKPDQPRQTFARRRSRLKGDRAALRGRADLKDLRFVRDRGQIIAMIRERFDVIGPAGPDAVAMAEAAASVNAAPVVAARSLA